eukprot:CAMPEP_0173191464 /NCGR_PEP_ID=MMETSP1141-20130122/12895_1 /TAXON_ID=483371 /ORGANISM="non described non described, Strain CCMP2298" /LENGTH=77 /DNA_ID=CAMNT_0014115647 /DNA_START=437 /DNA_END=667 /DNA_ORIENTATION=-
MQVQVQVTLSEQMEIRREHMREQRAVEPIPLCIPTPRLGISVVCSVHTLHGGVRYAVVLVPPVAVVFPFPILLSILL